MPPSASVRSAVLGVEALARIDRRDAAAVAEGAEEVERVGVAHRHDEQRAVVAVQAELDLGDQREQGAARWLRMAPFGLPVVPEVYISVHGSAGATGCAGLAAARAAAISVLVGAIAGRARRAPRNG